MTSTDNGDTPEHDRIAKRAYELWEAAGQPDGENEAFWYQAENEMGLGGMGDEAAARGFARDIAAPKAAKKPAAKKTAAPKKEAAPKKPAAKKPAAKKKPAASSKE